MIFLIIFCRIFQFVFNYGAKVLPWRKAIPVEGAGSIREIPGLLTGKKKPLLVTDPGLVKAGIASRITEVLQKADVPFVIYSEVEANPSVNTVNRIFELYRSEGCDCFIALGGGSAMDAAKAAAARVVHPRKTVNQMGGLLKVLRRIPLFIAVPTTAGTGSETTIAALITDTETHHKYAIMDLFLIPRYAVLDPELTVGLPPAITAATGMDALTHAIESYLCWTYSTRESTRFALDAVKAIFENLPRVYKNGADLEARLAMLKASYKAGFAFTRAGVGNIHAVAHTLGGLYNTPHGVANAVILPIVLEDYGKKVWKKLAKLAELAGVAPASAAGREEKAAAFINAIYKMNEDMQIPRFFDFIKSEDIPQITKWAFKESNPLYPVPVIYGRKRFRKIVEKLGIMGTYRIGEGCIGCGACARLCPVFAIAGEKGKKHEVNPLRCVGCGVCGRVCPSGGVSTGGKTCTAQKRSLWPKPRISKELCSACGICVKNCTPGALSISMPKERGDIRVYAELSAPEKCVACGLCEKHCPQRAITMELPK
ncbi:MAG: iron-containing alcohol dehydrogenase [Treponema sp.]|jgi:alcohol dehydrogenase class IV/Pyruvate/2-oxoacid:ferredoxin oxidoreductase delta subunit|nr:iron-containing alcohol dehydrogenase [Treponema sp.]